MILPITGYGHPSLRAQTVPAENNPETIVLINNMIETMSSIPTAVGLAANQINSNLSIFLAYAGNKIVVHVNPTIVKRRGKQKADEEGCLSIPGINGDVPDRDDIVDIVSYDINFNKQRMKLRGFESRIVQHELDHLNAILFIDHTTREGRETIADKLSQIEKGVVRTYYPMIFNNNVSYSPANEKNSSIEIYAHKDKVYLGNVHIK